MDKTNKFQFLDFLANIFDNLNFRFHEKCISEILELLHNSGSERKFLAAFETSLVNLDKLGRGVCAHKNFEKLKNCEFFSMRIRIEKNNYRILYAHEKEAVFLLAFYERGGKRKTDYTSRIPVAKKRLEEMNLNIKYIN